MEKDCRSKHSRCFHKKALLFPKYIWNVICNTGRKLELKGISLSYYDLIFSTLSWRSSLLCRNKSIGLQSKSVYLFLHDRDLRHEKVKLVSLITAHLYSYNAWLLIKTDKIWCIFLDSPALHSEIKHSHISSQMPISFTISPSIYFNYSRSSISPNAYVIHCATGCYFHAKNLESI